MRGGDAHHTRRHAGIDDGRQHRLAAALLHLHLPALDDAERREQRPVHARLRRLRVLRELQRRRAAHQRVGEVDRYVGHALDRRGASVRGLARPRRRVRLSSFAAMASAPATTDARTSAADSAVKPASLSIVPSTRSTFQPGRVSANGRTTPWNSCSRPSQLTNAPAVSVNGEIGSITSAYACAVIERAHHDDQVRLLQRVARGERVGEVELGLGVQHDVRLARARRASPARACRRTAAARRRDARRRYWRPRCRKPSVAPVVSATSCASA